MNNIKNKVVLVTGASSGIGRAIYLQLIRENWIVYGTSRRIDKGQVVDLDGGHMIHLDVNDDVSATKAMEIINEREGRLDALVNNAGYGIAGSIEDTSHSEVLAQFDTNFFGVLRLIRIALPALRDSQGIIINMGSVAGVLSIPFQSMYTASKAALEAMSETLRMELKRDKVRVCIIEPGDTKTAFTDNRQWVKAAKGSRYEARLQASIKKMAKDEQNGAPPEDVAKVACRMLYKKHPPVRRAIGFGYQLLLFLKRLLPDRLVIFILEKLYA